MSDEEKGWAIVGFFFLFIVLIIVMFLALEAHTQSQQGDVRIDALETRFPITPTVSIQDQLSALQTQVAAK